MQLNKIVSTVAVAALLAVSAAPASAQGYFNVGFGKWGRSSGFGVSFSAPVYWGRHYSYPAYYEPYYSYPVAVERTWVPGRWETRTEQVWVQGAERRVWVEPLYETTRDPAGNETRVLLKEGHWRIVRDPGRYETREVQVWIPGRYI
jgi:hypothetical protein